ncbi:MAG TPA: hypothetical protein VJ302_04130 [Blastocatellia bacterium]|nr:hypothetical protein [Blastocatellia bacterium]
MNRQLWFTSTRFAPLPGEEEQTNPECFGQALAIWVREQLVARGQAVSEDPIPEDWGWIVMIHREPFRLWVGCGNQDGTTERWTLFVVAELGLFQKLLKRVDPSPAVTTLERQLEEMIRAEPACHDVAWEFV